MFQRVVRIIGKVLGAAGAGFLVVLMLITGIDVVGRYVFQRPFMGAYELSELCMASVTLLGWAYTQAQKGHVDIDLVYTRLSRGTRTVLDFLIPLLGTALFVFVAWQSINFVMDSIGWHETTEMLKIPVWTFKLIIFIGAVAILLQFVADLITACQKAMGKA